MADSPAGNVPQLRPTKRNPAAAGFGLTQGAGPRHHFGVVFRAGQQVRPGSYKG